MFANPKIYVDLYLHLFYYRIYETYQVGMGGVHSLVSSLSATIVEWFTEFY